MSAIGEPASGTPPVETAQIDPAEIDPAEIDPAEIDTGAIERDLRDVEAALDALAEGTYWDTATDPGEPGA